MMMQVCLGRSTRVRWFSLFALAAGLAVAQTPETLARSYHESPTPPRRAQLEKYASQHSRDVNGAAAQLTLGITAFEQKDYPSAIAYLKAAQPRLTKLSDYVAYYLAAARVESQDPGVTSWDLAPVHSSTVLSPLDARANLVEARALTLANAPAGAIAILKAHSVDLPEPEGAMVLAAAQQAAGSLADAAASYQFVYCEYPVSEAATRATAALLTLRDVMGASYPQMTPSQLLTHADKLLAQREYAKARAAFRDLADQLSAGIERDAARVGVGAADYLNGNLSSAARYLQGLELPQSEAEAERLYYLAECARAQGDDTGMLSAIQRLGRFHPSSPWRFKALITAANRYLVANQPDQYLPLYTAAFESFPSETLAPYCHWKVAFDAYLHRRPDAGTRMRKHLEEYPRHPSAGAALYFLGRLAERDGNWAEARACYDKLTDLFPNYYYGVLADERLSQPKVAGATPSPETVLYLAGIAFPRRQRDSGREPTTGTALRIERARLLRSAGLSEEAEAELRFGARNDGQPPMLAVELARGADSPFQRLRKMKSVAFDYLAIPVHEAAPTFWEYLFPMPYQTDVVRNARQLGLDPFMVAALIRQESEFNPQALSHANAYGLTQVMPGTGRQLAKRLGVRRFSNRMLFEPSTNLKLGTYYLRTMLDKWGGKWEETLAAYNAGPTRVSDWSTWNHCEEPAEFVESIPFTETREYVQAVIRNAALYRRIYQDHPPPVAVAEAPKKWKAPQKWKAATKTKAAPAGKKKARARRKPAVSG